MLNRLIWQKLRQGIYAKRIYKVVASTVFLVTLKTKETLVNVRALNG